MLEHDWKAYLSQMSQMMQRVRASTRVETGIKLAELQTVEQYLLDRGSYFPRWTEPLEQMTAKECYSNCAHYALEHELLYCEGIGSGIIPVHHSWCYDSATRLVHDPTWWQHDWHQKKGSAPTYYGVAIEPEDLWDHINITQHFSIFDADWHSDFAVLRGETVLPFVELV